VRTAFERAASCRRTFIERVQYPTRRRAGAAQRTRASRCRSCRRPALPEGRAYEEFIGATGCVPTRDNLHDFFNGLVWLTSRASSKAERLAGGADRAGGVGKSRGPARDGATIFDENAALLVVRDGDAGRPWSAALRAINGTRPCSASAPAFGRDAQVWLFGHALMEKLVAPRKAITAHTRVVVAGDDTSRWPMTAVRTGWTSTSQPSWPTKA
jgi:hypothetical protein